MNPSIPITERPDNPPLVGPGQDYRTVTEKIGGAVLTRPVTRGWLLGFGLSFLGTMMLLATIGYLVLRGTGIWGNNIPVGWAFDIINFVWWIGIGHAGTLISAILLLLKQDWRTSINRFAEAMTLFAVACAGLYPLLHTGRPWLDYWMLPYPNTMQMWPQPRSPLVWDVFAVSTYATVSLLFWYVGLIPDLATLRDRAKFRWQAVFYGALSLGWRNSARHWYRYEMAYLLLAGLSTPLVLSVHTIVSFDFAYSQLPGWHTTVFPPYFVAGAIHSGFAMVLTLAIPTRLFYNFRDFITMRHLEAMAKVMIGTSWIVGYGYIMEIFMAWYSGSEYELYLLKNRMTGPYAWSYWMLWMTNIVAAQLFWFKRFRTSTFWLFALSIVINVGMWLERFVIIPVSLHRDFLPSSWDMYYPTVFDWSMFLGTIGFFLTLMFLFLRLLPAISIAEMKLIVPPPAESPDEARRHLPVGAAEEALPR